jgi:hypothetical protein
MLMRAAIPIRRDSKNRYTRRNLSCEWLDAVGEIGFDIITP